MARWSGNDVKRALRDGTLSGKVSEQLGGRPRPSKSKLNNVRCRGRGDIFPELAGRSFDSKLERDRATELVLLLRSGKIEDLTFQSTVVLQEASRDPKRKRVAYRADFRYVETFIPRPRDPCEKRVVHEEAKGLRKARWIMIRNLWPQLGYSLLRVTVRGRGGRIVVKDEIEPENGVECPFDCSVRCRREYSCDGCKIHRAHMIEEKKREKKEKECIRVKRSR